MSSYSYVYLYYFHESTNHVDLPNLYNTTLEAPGTQPLAMLLGGFFCGSHRIHFYLLLVLVMFSLATSISIYVRVPTEIQ